MLFSRSSQPFEASSFAKHFSSTWTAMNAAVDAPGEAPSRATIEWSALPTCSVPNSSTPVCFGVLVPFVRSARARLLKGQLDHRDRLADRVATHPAGKIDPAFLE
jgi:hypothetical protein